MGKTRLFLFSFILAFGTWMIYTLSLDYSGVIGVPVLAKCNLDGYAEYSNEPSIVSARCRTTGYHMLSHRFRPVASSRIVYFDTEDMVKEKENSFQVPAASLSKYLGDIFGESIAIESVIGTGVEFHFARENSIRVPVRAVSMLSYKSQYTSTGQIALVPDSVTIYGEPAYLASIDHINTKTLSLNGISSNLQGVVTLDVPGSIRCSHSEVSYSLGVTRFIEVEKSIPVEASGVPAGRELTVYPAKADVKLKMRFPVGESSLENLRLEVRYADFVSSRSGKCVPYIPELPSSVLDYSVEPQTFDILELL